MKDQRKIVEGFGQIPDKDLIEYCDTRLAESPEALFYSGHINRMLYLAAYPDWLPRQVAEGFFPMKESMRALVARARLRSRLRVIKS